MAYTPSTTFTFSGTAYAPSTTFDFDAGDGPATPDNLITGRGFKSLASITLTSPKPDAVQGRGFGTAPEIYGAAVVEGGGFSTTLGFSYQTDDTAYVTGRGFASQATLTLAADFALSVQGRGFSVTPKLYGAATVAGRGFNVTPTIGVGTSEYVSVSGHGFYSKATISLIAPTFANVTGRGFSSGLYYSRISGRGFTQGVQISTDFTAEYAEAAVMNLLTNVVTRYQNYPFLHIAKIGNSYYGFKADGVYQLTGLYDSVEDTPVNGTIHGKAHDFGVFNSKNVPYMYVNGDDEYTVTGYVDSEEQPAFTSGFSGRRVKLARGNKGRYWSFKIEGIQKLQGIELMPDGLSRRVK